MNQLDTLCCGLYLLTEEPGEFPSAMSKTCREALLHRIESERNHHDRFSVGSRASGAYRWLVAKGHEDVDMPCRELLKSSVVTINCSDRHVLQQKVHTFVVPELGH